MPLRVFSQARKISNPLETNLTLSSLFQVSNRFPLPVNTQNRRLSSHLIADGIDLELEKQR
jgi:hypothetical protein